jgi:hypothetical protein
MRRGRKRIAVVPKAAVVAIPGGEGDEKKPQLTLHPAYSDRKNRLTSGMSFRNACPGDDLELSIDYTNL